MVGSSNKTCKMTLREEEAILLLLLSQLPPAKPPGCMPKRKAYQKAVVNRQQQQTFLSLVLFNNSRTGQGEGIPAGKVVRGGRWSPNAALVVMRN